MARQLITCSGCGAINNVPDGQSGRPFCGRCGAALPEAKFPEISGPDSGKRMLGFLIAGILVLAVLTYAGVFDSPQPKPPMIVSEQSPPVPAPKVAPEPVSPKPVLAEPAFSEPPVSISTGLVMPPSSPGLAPLVLNTRPGGNFYVKLTSPDGEDVMSFYVTGGEPFETEVPLGDYEVKYAAGQIWYGTKFLFGPDTVRRRLRRKREEGSSFKFAQESGGYSGHEFDLKLVIDGNLSSDYIPENEF